MTRVVPVQEVEECAHLVLAATWQAGHAQQAAHAAVAGGAAAPALAAGAGGSSQLLEAGAAAAAAVMPACALQSAKLLVTCLSADFSLLPALKSLELRFCYTSHLHRHFQSMPDVEGSASLAAATALTELQLGGRGRGLPPSMAELIRCAPTSLQTLKLESRWGQEVAAALGSLTQLSALTLATEHSGTAEAQGPLPAAGCPMWGNLRVLSLCSAYFLEQVRGAGGQGAMRTTLLSCMLLAHGFSCMLAAPRSGCLSAKPPRVGLL